MSFEFCDAATWLDPSLKWKTLETRHFSIHFHGGLEDIAERFAPMAEEVHEELVRFMKHRPSLKTNIVLLDTVDYGNGFTSLFPDPRVVLYLTDWSTNLNPSKYDLWLKFVFTHEYAHVLHLDIADGLMGLYRFIFGRVTFINMLSPGFMIEGYPTFLETRYNQGGRGRDPRWEMIMRMDVLENNLKSIDRAAVRTVEWPMGHLRYLYGVEFLEYLAETYGEDTLATLAHVYGDLALYYGIDGAFLFVYRKSLGLLWDDWIEYLYEKYSELKESLGELTVPELVTRSGYYNLKPKWSRDQNYIYYQKRDADAYPSIRRLNLESGKEDKIFEGSVNSNNLSLDPAGKKLLFAKLDTYKNYYSLSDLYVFDLERSSSMRLTEEMRAGDADFSPDGSKIVLVRNERGTKTLWLMQSDGSNSRLLCSYEADVQYFSPRWSPDGKNIAVAKWIPGGDQKIYLVDPETGKQEKLTFETGLISEANPCFSPGGDYVFFDSDRTEIVNLYAYQLEAGRLFQITNVLGGAMMPDVSPDGKKLTYVSYSSRGYDIAVMDIDPSGWKEARIQEASAPYGEIRTKIKEITADLEPAQKRYNIHNYNPLPSLIPKFWVPFYYINENGYQNAIYTGGTDALRQHLYILQLGYDWDAEKATYSFLYANDQFLPQVVFGLSDVSLPYDWEGATLWMREKYESATFSFFDNRVFYEWDRQSFILGYEQTNITNIGTLESLSTRPSLGNVKGVFLGWGYQNTRSYPRSISAEDGIDLSLRVTMHSPDLGSDYTFTNYSGNAAYYLPAFSRHNVLVPKLYGFYSRGNQLEQSNFSWRYLPLRGYPSTNLKGNKGILLSTEYRFPMFYPEGGFYYGMLFFDRIWGDLFFDMGGATFEPVSNLKLKRSYGLELNFNILDVWGNALSILKIGYVKGLDEDGEEKFYVSIGL